MNSFFSFSQRRLCRGSIKHNQQYQMCKRGDWFRNFLQNINAGNYRTGRGFEVARSTRHFGTYAFVMGFLK